MFPRPVAVGMTLCDYVILEEGTTKSSLIGSFNSIKLTEFPGIPQPFCVYSVLTDGNGDALINLTVTRLESDEEIYSLEREIHFPSRLTEVYALFRVRECSFPVAGTYLFSILIDGESIAHHRIRVYLGSHK